MCNVHTLDNVLLEYAIRNVHGLKIKHSPAFAIKEA